MSSSSEEGPNYRNVLLAVSTYVEELADILDDSDDDVDEYIVPIPRSRIERDRDGGNDRLMRDYFDEDARYPPYVFRRRFRMHKPLFLRIVTEIATRFHYFRQNPDGRGTLGFTPIQKCTAALRMLAYVTHPDAIDETLRMSARTARETLVKFCKALLLIYGQRYLRRPTYNDVQQLYVHHANHHGLPGMLGSLDCLHWAWGNCPNALQGQYTRGDHGHPTVILEAVASQDLWIWHAYFGAPGSWNDINVLNSSPLFNRIYDGSGPDTSFQVNGSNHPNGYYLVDGIYPEKSVLVKAYTCPDDPKRKKFKKAQERARKDVERAFGALKKRWHVLKTPAPYMKQWKMNDIMYACIVLHNMILEDEGRAICQPGGPIADPPPPEVFPYGTPQYSVNKAVVNNSEAHHILRGNLVEHIWNVNHVDLNVEPPADPEDEFSEEDNF